MPETSPTVKQVLAGAVKALGGQERPGQIQMAEAVSRLQMAQFSVQASAQVFSMLQQTSLLNFLKL